MSRANSSWPARAVARLDALSPRALVWGSALAAGLVATLCFAPRYWLWPAVGVPLGDLVAIQPELNRAFFALQQLAHPWAPVADPTNRVIEWRLLFPLLGHSLRLPEAIYLALPHAGCVLALAAVAGTAWRVTADRFVTLGLAVLAATTSWFFVATGWLAYFDSWLMAGLLLASFGRHRAVLLAAALLTPWIDERFILALPLALAVRGYGPGAALGDRRRWWTDAAVLAAGVVPYLAIRLGAELTQVRATSQSYWSDRPLLPAPWHATLWATWSGLRLAWIPVAAFVLATSGRSRWLAGGLVAITLAVNLCVADDLSRSMSIALPAMVAGALQLWRKDPGRFRRLLPWLCAGNLLLPAHHVIASPGNPETTHHSVPVLSLPAEWARSNEPPYIASPFVYNRRGMDAFQQGDRARAMAAFDLALRFDPDFSRARANRGILNFLAGDRTGGMADIDAALLRSPQLWEIRMRRAGFRQQLGDLRGALEDARLTLRTMPADSNRRAELEKLERTLAAQLPR